MRLQAHRPEDRLIGALTFAMDWAGDNNLQLWLCRFEPPGDASRWASVRAPRFTCQQPGYWPAVLHVGDIAVSNHAPTWRVNV